MSTISEFNPTWWLSNRHLQTIFPSLLRKRPTISLTSERLELPDGDFIDLEWTQRNHGPLIIVLHGLEGNLQSHYVCGLLKALQTHGFNVVFMYSRGCSGEPNRLARRYHAGETGDIHHVLSVLSKREPDRPIAAVGISLGGNALLKYLGEQGGNTQIKAAVAVSVPFDLNISASALEHGFARYYQRHLVDKLKTAIAEKHRTVSLPFPLPDLDQVHTLRQFDDQITAPLHGFNGVDDYYTQSSCRQYLKNIRIPTLILHAKDDPFMTPAAIPGKDELSGSIDLHLTEHGGHVGFIHGNPPIKPHYWLEESIPAWLKQGLKVM